MQELHDLAQAQALALAIVDTLPEPFLVLDDSLQLLAGSRCFYEIYDEDPATAHGRSMFELSGGQWDIPGLRQLLAAVIDDRTTIDSFEFERVFTNLSRDERICQRAISSSARIVREAVDLIDAAIVQVW